MIKKESDDLIIEVRSLEERIFEPGQFLMTAGVYNRFIEDKKFAEFVASSLDLYLNGFWRDTCEEDSALNDNAVKFGFRIFAVYKDCEGTEIWIITEDDRSATTILFPYEY